MRHDLVAERRGELAALREDVLDALADDAHGVPERPALGRPEGAGERVREDRRDVVAEPQEQGVVTEQLEGSLEGTALWRCVHQVVGAGEVVVEDLADGADLLPEVLDDRAVHRRDRLLHALEVAGELTDEVGDVRVAVAHPGVVHRVDVTLLETGTLGLELGDLRVDAADLHVGSGSARAAHRCTASTIIASRLSLMSARSAESASTRDSASRA
ncbi:hypothetical protein P9139_14130 [Curtobacterium flaccumfaciens]|nr:hypothetical protein P9139_14130 [Curtobacterium flaccumfaciens]